MRRVDSLEETLMLGGIGGKRKREWQRMRWLDGITDWMDVNSGRWWWTGRPGVLRFMGSQRVDMTERLNWTELIQIVHFFLCELWQIVSFRNQFILPYRTCCCCLVVKSCPTAGVQLQQPGSHPEGMSGVGGEWCSLWLEVRGHMFISSIRSSFILWQKH